MIDWIVAFALRKRLVMMAAAIFTAIYGYYSWTQLALEAYPDIADVTSQGHYPGSGVGGRRSRAANHDSIGA